MINQEKLKQMFELRVNENSEDIAKSLEVLASKIRNRKTITDLEVSKITQKLHSFQTLSSNTELLNIILNKEIVSTEILNFL